MQGNTLVYTHFLDSHLREPPLRLYFRRHELVVEPRVVDGFLDAPAPLQRRHGHLYVWGNG